jgi:hypothetical protein
MQHIYILEINIYFFLVNSAITSPKFDSAMSTEANPPPKSVEEDLPPPGWGTDDRISFSRESGKYLQTQDDGSEMEWNARFNAWMPVVCPIAWGWGLR